MWSYHSRSTLITLLLSFTHAFIQQQQQQHSLIVVQQMSAHVNTDQQSTPEHHPFCDLPGDPSLILTTNVDLGDKKMAIMKCELILQLCLLAFLSRVVYFQGLIIF